MTFYKNRKRFEPLSLLLGKHFSKIPISPNGWTLLSLLPAFITLWFLVQEQVVGAAIFLLITSFIDIIDGGVARFTGRTTKFGGYIDTIADRYVEAVIIVGLTTLTLPAVFIPATVWIFLYFFGAMMTTYSKSAAKEKEVVTEEIKGGLLERAERLVILFFGLLVASFDKTYFVYILALLAILTNISALQRIRIVYKKAGKSKFNF